jgi:hypothetical protein
LTDKTLQARLASELFGRTGVEMTVLFNEGAEGINRFGNQLESVNGIMKTDSIRAIQDFNDKWNLLTKAVRGFLLDSKALDFLSGILDTMTDNIKIMNQAFGFTEKKVKNINQIAEELNKARKETLELENKIKESTGFAKIDAIGRLETNKKQIKQLQIELLQSKKIENNVEKQEKAQNKVKNGIEVTNKVAKQLVKTTKPLMIGGKLNIPAIGGRKGLGGTLEKFTKFYLNLMKLAEDYLGSGFGVSAIVKKHLAIIRQDFSEMITGLENQLVFRRNDISNAFSDLLNDIQRQIETKKITVNFDGSKIEGAQRKLSSLVNQINNYSAGSRTVTRGAGVYLTNAVLPNDPYHTNIYWEDEWPRNKEATMAFDSDLSYQVPTINSGSSSSRQSGGGYSGGSSAMSNQGSGVVVNVFDGTGQKISEYDSSIRIQINERANRYGEFPALPVS